MEGGCSNLIGVRRATDQFHHDLDCGIRNDLSPIVYQFDG